MNTITLYRPTGPKELKLVEKSGFKKWPPRLPEQPIFYPVTTSAYAEKIARDWNVKDNGCGYVTEFQIDAEFLSQYPVQVAGGREHSEYWIPAEELEEFNRHIIGKIKVIKTFK